MASKPPAVKPGKATHKRQPTTSKTPARKIGTGPLDAADVAELRRRGTLAQWLKDPGLRSRLPSTALPTAQRKARELETRLNAPIATGSTMTGRDLAHAAAAASTVKYGPAEQELATQYAKEQQAVKDVGGWFDQYQAQVAQGARNVGDINARAQQQLAALNTGVGQQGVADVASIQNAINQATPAGAPPAANLSTLGAQATAARQNMVGSFQAQQDLSGAAQQGYMNQMAQLVAPAQKLEAVAQQQGRVRDVQAQQKELAAEKGAFNLSTRQDILQREQNYGIAAAGLGIKAAEAANKPATETTYDKEFSKQAAKYGYTPHAWAMLGRKGRQTQIEKANKQASGGKGAGDHYGYTDAQWAKMTPDAKRKAYKDWQAAGRDPSSPKATDAAKQEDAAFRQKYGVDPLDTKGHNDAKNDISRASTWIKRIQDANRKEHDSSVRAHQKDPKHKIKPVLTLGQIGQLLSTGSPAAGPGSAAIPQIPALMVRVAMDLSQGGITAGTAARLHKAGYKVKLLGVKNRAAVLQPTGPGTNTSYGAGAGAGSGIA